MYSFCSALWLVSILPMLPGNVIQAALHPENVQLVHLADRKPSYSPNIAVRWAPDAAPESGVLSRELDSEPQDKASTDLFSLPASPQLAPRQAKGVGRVNGNTKGIGRINRFKEGVEAVENGLQLVKDIKDSEFVQDIKEKLGFGADNESSQPAPAPARATSPPAPSLKPNVRTVSSTAVLSPPAPSVTVSSATKRSIGLNWNLISSQYEPYYSAFLLWCLSIVL